MFYPLYVQTKTLLQKGIRCFISSKDMAKEVISNLEKRIADCEKGLIELTTQYYVLAEKTKNEEKKTIVWQGRALKALEVNNQTLARKAAAQVLSSRNLIMTYEAQLNQIEPRKDFLERKILEMNSQKELLVAKIELLSTQYDVSKAQEEIELLLSGIAGNLNGQTLAQFENEVLNQTAKAFATTEVVKRLSGKNIDDEFKELDQQEEFLNVDKYLASLKEQNQNLLEGEVLPCPPEQ